MIKEQIALVAKVNEILKDERHWTQGAFKRNKWFGLVQARCLVGAEMEARRQLRFTGQRTLTLNHIMSTVTNVLETDVIYFNDVPGRTFRDVKDALGRTLLRLRKMELEQA